MPLWAQISRAFGACASSLSMADIVDMSQHDQPALLGQLHQASGGGSVGVGAVVEVELAQAAIRTGLGAGGESRSTISTMLGSACQPL